MLVKGFVVSQLRQVVRGYLRYVPWTVGKAALFDFYATHIAWREFRTLAKTCFGAHMDLELPDFVSGAIYATGCWEPALTHYVEENLAAGDTFIDVGANIGYYTLLAASITGTHGRVIAVEASPSIHSRLKRNLALNGFVNVTAINAAAASAPGELSIYLNEHQNLGHSTTVDDLASKEGMRFESKVRADRLGSLVGEECLRGARLIKVDVEGAELAVLGPLFGDLASFSPETEWLIECSPQFCPGGQADVDAIFGAFRAAGYLAFQIPNSYKAEFMVDKSKVHHLRPLDRVPTEQCDVLMTRRRALASPTSV
jgi:FkbM family methyltransferase